MSSRCIAPEQLARILELPEEHADRRHLRDCPRCRSLAKQFESFLRQPGTPNAAVPEGASLQEARTTFQQRLKDVLGKDARISDAQQTPPRPRILQLRPILAAAAVLIAVVGLSWWRERAPLSDDLLRGAPSERGTLQIRVEDAVQEGDGWALRWSVVPKADAYEVRIYSESLEEVARFGPLQDNAFDLFPENLPSGDAVSAASYWRVFALTRGDPLARSALMELPAD